MPAKRFDACWKIRNIPNLFDLLAASVRSDWETERREHFRECVPSTIESSPAVMSAMLLTLLEGSKRKKDKATATGWRDANAHCVVQSKACNDACCYCYGCRCHVHGSQRFCCSRDVIRSHSIQKPEPANTECECWRCLTIIVTIITRVKTF